MSLQRLPTDMVRRIVCDAVGWEGGVVDPVDDMFGLSSGLLSVSDVLALRATCSRLCRIVDAFEAYWFARQEIQAYLAMKTVAVLRTAEGRSHPPLYHRALYAAYYIDALAAVHLQMGLDCGWITKQMRAARDKSFYPRAKEERAAFLNAWMRRGWEKATYPRRRQEPPADGRASLAIECLAKSFDAKRFWFDVHHFCCVSATSRIRAFLPHLLLINRVSSKFHMAIRMEIRETLLVFEADRRDEKHKHPGVRPKYHQNIDRVYPGPTRLARLDPVFAARIENDDGPFYPCGNLDCDARVHCQYGVAPIANLAHPAKRGLQPTIFCSTYCLCAYATHYDANRDKEGRLEHRKNPATVACYRPTCPSRIRLDAALGLSPYAIASFRDARQTAKRQRHSAYNVADSLYIGGYATQLYETVKVLEEPFLCDDLAADARRVARDLPNGILGDFTRNDMELRDFEYNRGRCRRQKLPGHIRSSPVGAQQPIITDVLPPIAVEFGPLVCVTDPHEGPAQEEHVDTALPKIYCCEACRRGKHVTRCLNPGCEKILQPELAAASLDCARVVLCRKNGDRVLYGYVCDRTCAHYYREHRVARLCAKRPHPAKPNCIEPLPSPSAKRRRLLNKAKV